MAARKTSKARNFRRLLRSPQSDARLCGQGRLIVTAFDVEIPDGARETLRDWRVKVCAVEGREITRRTPELSADAQDNFFSRLLREHAEPGIDQCL